MVSDYEDQTSTRVGDITLGNLNSGEKKGWSHFVTPFSITRAEILSNGGKCRERNWLVLSPRRTRGAQTAFFFLPDKGQSGLLGTSPNHQMIRQGST